MHDGIVFVRMVVNVACKCSNVTATRSAFCTCHSTCKSINLNSYTIGFILIVNQFKFALLHDPRSNLNVHEFHSLK